MKVFNERSIVIYGVPFFAPAGAEVLPDGRKVLPDTRKVLPQGLPFSTYIPPLLKFVRTIISDDSKDLL